jgi:hypothetical protein
VTMKALLPYPLFAGLVGVAAVLRLSVEPLAPIVLTSPSLSPPSASGSTSSPAIARDSLAMIVSRDVFRFGRRALLPAYDPLRLAEQLAPRPPKPLLTLVGLVNGAAPSAVLEGLPGTQGSRVVHVGDLISGLQIKAISNGRVVVAGMDTTWVLEVREPWKP